MGQKGRALANGVSAGSLEKRKRDKTVAVLDGLVADLARRTQSSMDGYGPTQHLESIRAIHRLLGQIQKLERPFVIQPNAPDVSARLKILHDWLQQQGIQMAGLKLQGGLPEGAGVVAEQQFKKGQLLCTVAAHAMMTTATAIRSKDDVGVLFKADPILRQMPTLILALHLLFEKHRLIDDPSNWAGYIASLPGQVPSTESNSNKSDNFIMPLGFSSETIEALKGTAVLVEMHKALRNYARQYAHVRLLLKQLRTQSEAIERANTWFTWAEFRWAASIIMTRQNPIPGTPDMETGQALALIPYLDMFNHEEGEITCHFAVQHQQMELTAKRDFEAGEQVYISYGYRPNSALLLYSGFVPDVNSKDRIKVPVELPPSDQTLYAKKAALLKWLELPSSGWLELYHDGTPSTELATWIRVATMKDISVVTENLRAAIASRAQETAAVLQYKAALREAEEKAKVLALQEAESANATAEPNNASGTKESDTPSAGAPAVEDAAHVVKGDDVGISHEASSNGGNGSIPVPDAPQDKASEAQREGSTWKEEPPLEVQELNEAESDLTPVTDGNPDGATATELPARQGPDGIENASGEKENVGEQRVEHILGEYLYPEEAALLGEICRIRINEFGSDVQKVPEDISQMQPQGLGLGLQSGPQPIQPKSQSKELRMAVKIRRQEQLTLLRAVDRGARYRHIHSKDCHHCH